MDNKILVTGGEGRFAKILKNKNKKLNLIFCSKKQLDILNLKSIKKNFKILHTVLCTKSGGSHRIRTCDQLVKSQLLYQLS